MDARRAFPIENIDQLPGVLIEVDLQPPALIHHELGLRKQYARSLIFVLVVQVDFAACQVEGLRLGIAEENLRLCRQDDGIVKSDRAKGFPLVAGTPPLA